MAEKLGNYGGPAPISGVRRPEPRIAVEPEPPGHKLGAPASKPIGHRLGGATGSKLGKTLGRKL